MIVRIRPTDAINAAALAVLTCLTLYVRHRLADPAAILGLYAALGIGLALIALLARRVDRLSTPMRGGSAYRRPPRRRAARRRRRAPPRRAEARPGAMSALPSAPAVYRRARAPAGAAGAALGAS